MTPRSVLIIGGGAAGSQIAQQLRGAVDRTLVDRKTYWEGPMAAPRLLTAPETMPARIRHNSFLATLSMCRAR